MAVNKAQVLFYLNRYVKLAEARAEFNQEAAAKRGMDYATRQKMVEEAESAKPEAEALRTAMRIVEGADDFFTEGGG